MTCGVLRLVSYGCNSIYDASISWVLDKWPIVVPVTVKLRLPII